MIKTFKVCCVQKVIPLAFDESLSYLEMLCGMLNKLNETIAEVNKMADVVDNIDANFDEINEKIAVINAKLVEIDEHFDKFEVEIMDEVNEAVTNIYNRIVVLMNEYQSVFNANLNALRTDLESEIRSIELGNVIAYDPTTGEYENVSTVIMNVYDVLRNNAITASEFDALELTATEYDALEISAYNFDVNGRTFLLGE